MDALLLTLLMCGFVWALLHFTRNLRRPDQGEGRRAERALEEELLRLTRGNRGAIERGVTAQRRQHPQASRAELLRRVRDEYVRDRSR
ncbi:hypothetical protein [Deinococcus radiotolerans]|uniref:Uncharacterized protein n=1 Tax=Deinococcus radiotolerans TaxID=1309407 RepID=A0ABQ2FHB2_9DEIO|nr:hypothetical protein [Deinococcus radiotolerans]GGK98719.1 hypothetical protein GCM10010844_16180 [Deinococcus radiotolerans]